MSLLMSLVSALLKPVLRAALRSIRENHTLLKGGRRPSADAYAMTDIGIEEDEKEASTEPSNK
jgi:hypothetical protein